MKIAGKERCIRCMEPLVPGEKCKKCLYNEQSYQPGGNSLLPGFCLHERYFLGAVIGEGGFGITYIAWDVVLAIPVAIKEYFPQGLAARDLSSPDQADIHAYEGEAEQEFKKGLKNFLKEARTLSKFLNLDGIVSVRDFFQEHQTAYIVMEYIDGIRISDYINLHGKMSGDEVLRLAKPILTSLQEIHEAHLIHRDISADNLMLTQRGNLQLLDFGAARATEVSSDTMTISIKRGFSPEEQYRANGNQNAGTDIYSLCATMYFMLTGIIPEEAVERVISDRVVPLADQTDIDLSEKQRKAIDRGMSVMSKDRFSEISLFYKELYDDEPPKKSVISSAPEKNTSGKATELHVSKTSLRRELNSMLDQNLLRKSRLKKYLLVTGICLLAAALLYVLLLRPQSKPKDSEKNHQPDKPIPASTSSPDESTAAPEENPSVQSSSIPDAEWTYVPDVTDMSWTNAKKALRKKNLSAKKVVQENTKKQGLVFRQDIKSGKQIQQGTEITLYVSKGMSPDQPSAAPTQAPKADQKTPTKTLTKTPEKAPAKTSTKQNQRDYSASIDDYLN